MTAEAQEIPKDVLEKHPKLLAISEAIEQHRSSQPVAVLCSTCGNRLVVTDFPELGSLWVGCEIGCTKFQMKYKPVLEK